MGPLLLAALFAAEPGRLIVVQAGEAEVECVARDAGGAERPGRLAGNGPWTWSPEPGDTVSCGAVGYEPVQIDIARALAGRALAIELLPARPVTLEGPGAAIDGWIEWRSLGEGGTSLLARQTTHFSDHITLPVAHAGRVIRVRAAGSAPISVLVPEGSEPLTLRLPPPRPGGELLVRWPAHAYTPDALEATLGTAAHAIEPKPSAVLRATTLAPGTYAIVPRYRGGVRGPRLRAVVRAGETAEVFPPAHPEPGAATVSLAREICNPGRLPLELQLRRVAPSSTQAGPNALLTERFVDPPCVRELEGLAPGAYEAQIDRGGEGAETLSASRFAVLPGQKTVVTLTPSVRVAGRVVYADDSPAAGLALRFSSEGRVWSAQTDLNGEYSGVLGDPGEYAIAVASTSLTRALQAGEQRVDLRLGETRLTVRVVRENGARLDEAAQLVLTSQAGRRITAGYGPDDEEQAQFVGLEHGEYALTARTASGLTSKGAVAAQLTPQKPEADVEVVMGRHEGRVLVVDEQGQPIAQAAASAGGRALEPTAAGVFPVGGVALGEWLNVRAEGYTPVCRILQARDLPEARVTLVRPTEGLTVHAPLEMAWESALLRGLPGSDCPVEIHDVGVSLQMGADRTSLTLRLPRGRFELLRGDAASPLVAPGQDVVLR